MKSDYRVRAMKFLRSIFPYIEGYMGDFDDVQYQVEKVPEVKEAIAKAMARIKDAE